MHREWKQKGSQLLSDIASTQCQWGEAAVWFLGQCGVAVKTCEATFYIDAVLTDLLDKEGNTRRYFVPPFDPTEIKADYFLCTHGHRDHLTPETVKKAAKGCKTLRFIVPAACQETVEGLGVPTERILSAKAGETIETSGIRVVPVSAAHPVHTVDEQGRNVALSYFIESGGVTLLHVGDTYLTKQLLHDYQALSHPDLFFPPINGGDYFRTARGCIGNLNPIEAARLAVMLKAGLTIPTHYDMMTGNTADPLDFVRCLLMEDTAACWKLPALGEKVIYRR